MATDAVAVGQVLELATPSVWCMNAAQTQGWPAGWASRVRVGVWGNAAEGNDLGASADARGEGVMVESTFTAGQGMRAARRVRRARPGTCQKPCHSANSHIASSPLDR